MVVRARCIARGGAGLDGGELRFFMITSDVPAHAAWRRPGRASRVDLGRGRAQVPRPNGTRQVRALLAASRRCRQRMPTHPSLCGRCVDNVAGGGETRSLVLSMSTAAAQPALAGAVGAGADASTRPARPWRARTWLHEPRARVRRVLNWTLAHNLGVAFSMFNDGAGWQRFGCSVRSRCWCRVCCAGWLKLGRAERWARWRSRW